MKKALFTIFFLCLLLFFPKQVHASTILFQDNFESGNDNQWTELSGQGLWKVVDINGSKWYGATINNGNTIIDTVAGNTSWTDYEFDLDVLPISGEDKNIRFRWDPNRFPFPGFCNQFHFNNNGINIDRGGGASYTMNNGQVYHLKVLLKGNNYKLFIDGSNIVNFNDPVDPSCLHGKIGLTISTGSATPTEVYFDNIVVKTIDDIPVSDLNVPYFNQNALPWGTMEYDHATSLGIPSPSMDRWGCAVTSAAMVLNFHTMTKLPDGTTNLDPGTLNTWLKNNKGYLTGKDNTGSGYSYLVWPAISTLTKQLRNNGLAPYELEHVLETPGTQTTNDLNADLTSGNAPAILQVHNASTSGHFVVAKGKTNTTYDINDPEWNAANLTSFGNTYTQVDRFIPAHSDLSYIVMVINPSEQLLITDPHGQKTGSQWINGSLTSFNEIPGAYYGFENPINNPLPNGNLQNLGTGMNVFLLPKPTEGTYTIQASGNTPDEYTVNFATFTSIGDETVQTYFQTGGSPLDSTYYMYFTKTDASSPYYVPTADQAIKDVKTLRKLGKIKNDFSSIALILLLQDIKYDISHNHPKDVKRDLSLMETLLNKEKNKSISSDAYQILFSDAESLKASL